MVRVELWFGAGVEGDRRVEVILAQMPRVGEYIAPEAAEIPKGVVVDEHLWRVVAVVHQRLPSPTDARVHAAPATEFEILDIFEPAGGDDA